MEELEAEIRAAYFEAVNERKAPTRETTPTTVARGEDSFFPRLGKPDKQFWQVATAVAGFVAINVLPFWLMAFGVVVTKEVHIATGLVSIASAFCAGIFID